MRGKLRVMTMSLLSLTGLCTAMLFACAGGNAVQTFLNRTAAEAAQPADRPLTGMVIAIDADTAVMTEVRSAGSAAFRKKD